MAPFVFALDKKGLSTAKTPEKNFWLEALHLVWSLSASMTAPKTAEAWDSSSLLDKPPTTWSMISRAYSWMLGCSVSCKHLRVRPRTPTRAALVFAVAEMLYSACSPSSIPYLACETTSISRWRKALAANLAVDSRSDAPTLWASEPSSSVARCRWIRSSRVARRPSKREAMLSNSVRSRASSARRVGLSPKDSLSSRTSLTHLNLFSTSPAAVFLLLLGAPALPLGLEAALHPLISPISAGSTTLASF